MNKAADVALIYRAASRLFAVYLRELKLGELKVLLVLVWKKVDSPYPSKRQQISRKELARLTGLSPRAITTAIAQLEALDLIHTSAKAGKPLSFELL